MQTWMCGVVLALSVLAVPGKGAATDTSLDRSAVSAVAEDIVREVGDRRLVLLGEKHGTREIPWLVADLLDTWSSTGPVRLGLEIPRNEQRALDSYMASDGGERARTALRQSTFWSQARGDQHDGRRSHDMLALIEHARDLRSRGRAIRLFAYDRASTEAIDHHARDRAMAASVSQAHRSDTDTRTVVLAGNVHAMLRRPAAAPKEMQLSMGWHLRDLQPFAIDVVARDGDFWACVGGRCGQLASMAPPRSQRMHDAEFHYRAVLPTFTVAALLGTP